MKTVPPARKTVYPPTHARLRMPLATVADCRRALAAIIRQAKAGTLGTGDASKLANMIYILSRLISGADIEARLLALELEHERSN